MTKYREKKSKKIDIITAIFTVSLGAFMFGVIFANLFV